MLDWRWRPSAVLASPASHILFTVAFALIMSQGALIPSRQYDSHDEGGLRITAKPNIKGTNWCSGVRKLVF